MNMEGKKKIFCAGVVIGFLFMLPGYLLLRKGQEEVAVLSSEELGETESEITVANREQSEDESETIGNNTQGNDVVSETEQSEDEVYLEATEEDWEKIVTSDMDGFDVVSKSIKVEYPQFRQMKGYPTEVNALLEEDIKYHCNDIYNISCPYNLKGKVTYLDENYISVLYQGTSYPATSANDFAWATTVDMRTCTIVGIEDVAELSGVLEKLEQTKFEQVRGIALDYYEELKPGYEESPINWKEKYENLSMGSYDENHYYDFYLKKDKIGILLGVEEAIGAYIIVEIDR